MLDKESRRQRNDPVDPITGAFHVEAVDLRIPGPFPLDIGLRNYSSQNLSDMNNFGFGWRINYIPYINVTTNGTGSTTNILLFASEMDGSLVGYRMQSTNTNVFPPHTLLDNPDTRQQHHGGNWFHGKHVQCPHCQVDWLAPTCCMHSSANRTAACACFRKSCPFPLTWTQTIWRAPGPYPAKPGPTTGAIRFCVLLRHELDRDGLPAS